MSDILSLDNLELSNYAHLFSGGGTAPFVPTDIGGCILWLRADGIIGLSDGDPVGTWADESGSGNDISQATEVYKPTYKTGIRNGKPVVRFDGGDDYLYKDSRLSTSNVGMISMAIYIKSVDTGGFFCSGKMGANVYHTCRQYNTGNRIYLHTAAIQYYTDNGYAADNWYILSFRGDGSTYKWYKNGSLQTWTAGTGYTWWEIVHDTMAVGTIRYSSFQNKYPFDGDIAELVVYEADIGDSDRESVESYLNTKYAIY